MTAEHGSRRLAALLRRGGDPQHPERLILAAPSVGYFCDAPALGTILQPGEVLGRFERLGQVAMLTVPDHAQGRVTDVVEPTLARKAVSYGQVLVVVDPSAAATQDSAQANQRGTATNLAKRMFKSPTSGRFYARPAPDRPPFLVQGETIEIGKTIGLIEVMKTFTRIHFNGPSLPPKVTITEIFVKDQDELASGDPLFSFEVAGE